MKEFSKETREKMSISAQKRCTEEWRMKKTQQLSTKIDIERLKCLYEQGYTQTEIAEQLGITQKVVWKCMKNNGISARLAAKRNQFKENNHMWKGGKVIDTGGHVLVKCCEHPRAKNCGGYVYEHVLIIERQLGRYLNWYGPGHPESEIVHHKNGNKQDNRLENLELVTFMEHMRIHNELRKRVV